MIQNFKCCFQDFKSRHIFFSFKHRRQILIKAVTESTYIFVSVSPVNETVSVSHFICKSFQNAAYPSDIADADRSCAVTADQAVMICSFFLCNFKQLFAQLIFIHRIQNFFNAFTLIQAFCFNNITLFNRIQKSCHMLAVVSV